MVRVVLLAGSQANQRALAHRLDAIVPLAAIVSVTPASTGAKGKKAPGRLRRAVGAAVGLPLRRAWFAMLGHYDRLFPAFPRPPEIETGDVNDAEVLRLITASAPDLVVVSGTNLLKRPLIEAIARSGKVMNLHTGISPYIRGGPNCTNWALALGRFDLIGSTVMWLDAGIDSGALIATERTALTGWENLAALHLAVMEHAHALYVRCVRRFVAGEPLPAVPQGELGEGQLFLSRHWGPRPIASAVARHRFGFAGKAAGPHPPLELVSPENGRHLA